MPQSQLPYCYEYPRPAITVDIVLFAREEDEPNVLLIQRAKEPFKGMWALPGGFVDENEPLELAAHRELLEETCLGGIVLQQLQAFGDPGRDPRGWTVSVAFVGLADGDVTPPKGADDAADARWFPVSALPPLAFDHDRIIQCALERQGLKD